MPVLPFLGAAAEIKPRVQIAGKGGENSSKQFTFAAKEKPRNGELLPAAHCYVCVSVTSTQLKRCVDNVLEDVQISERVRVHYKGEGWTAIMRSLFSLWSKGGI